MTYKMNKRYNRFIPDLCLSRPCSYDVITIGESDLKKKNHKNINVCAFCGYLISRLISFVFLTSFEYFSLCNVRFCYIRGRNFVFCSHALQATGHPQSDFFFLLVLIIQTNQILIFVSHVLLQTPVSPWAFKEFISNHLTPEKNMNFVTI